MNEFLGLVWSQFWQLTVLIGVVALLGATVLRNRPHMMHILWIIVVVKSLTVPLWSSPIGVFSRLQPHVNETVSFDGLLAPAPSPSTVKSQMTRDTTISEMSQPIAAGTRVTAFLGYGLFALWIGGVVVLLGLAGRRWVEVYRVLKTTSQPPDRQLERVSEEVRERLGMKPGVRVLVSEANLGPMVFGSYRPVLILPKALRSAKSSNELRPIIAHELLHARRGDTTLGVLLFLAQLTWWFHPLMWWACRQANRISERCCDEEVISNLGCRPRDYARCLLDALELRCTLNTTPALPGIRSADITTQRLANLLDKSRRFRRRAPLHYSVFAIGLAFIVFPGAGLLVQATDESASEVVSGDTQTLRDRAERAVAGGDWDQATTLFRQLTDRNGKDARAWFMLAFSLHASGQLDEAIVAHRRAATFPQVRPIALYNLACALALQGDADASINALNAALESGFMSARPIENDPDFASLRDDRRFQKLAGQAMPSSDREVYRQFDFWVGEWNVTDRKGKRIGNNVITKDEKGFLLTEKWTDAEGRTGTSISYYDRSDRQWKRTWVDANGTVVHYRGGFKDEAMTFDGRLTTPSGVVVASRVSYFPEDEGKVRQRIEHSHDDGRTWMTFFEGIYVPRTQPADLPPAVTGVRTRPPPNTKTPIH